LDDFNTARQNVAAFYFEHLKGIKEIELPYLSKHSTHIYNQFTIKVSNNKRDNLKQYLEKNEVPSMVYYPIPLHLQPAFSGLRYTSGRLPITEKLCSEVLSLPMHTELSEEQLQFICSKMVEFFN